MIADIPNGFLRTGRLKRVAGTVSANLQASLQELVHIRTRDQSVAAEVIGFDSGQVHLMPLVSNAEFHEGDLVVASGHKMLVPVGFDLLGRVINSSGHPIDSRDAIMPSHWVATMATPPDPMSREDIVLPFETGVRAIDGLIPIGKGQRVGVFAGSGVGKSTLLGNIARQAESDINVVALVGERGREVRPFIEETLGHEGMKRSVVIVSTSDESPLSRIRAVESSIAIANWFREQGLSVLLMMDSLTRFANAQKELGLMLGEPPTTRGYPASVFQKMAMTLEQLGNSDSGAITGIITVLVDGDDMNEPIADAARSILDGHVVLTRRLAERNHFPAIDVLASVSRIARKISNPEKLESMGAVRNCIALYRDIEDLIQMGAYQPGRAPRSDGAIKSIPEIDRFLQQNDQKSRLEDTHIQIKQLADLCRSNMGAVK